MTAFQSTVTEAQARLLEAMERGETPGSQSIGEDLAVGGDLDVAGELAVTGDASCDNLDAGGDAAIGGDATVTGGLGVFGAAAPAAQPAAIADVTGGPATTDTDVEARAAIDDILAVLREAGLIDT
jgi:hypothetical protein